MYKRRMILSLVVFGLSGCGQEPAARLVADGLQRSTVYRISPGQEAEIRFRMLDTLNALRLTAGLAPVELENRLNAAAAVHSRDMALQDRPWLFGSDGSSPFDRLQRVGFSGRLLGEIVSETYETELQTIDAWMGQDSTRGVLLNPYADLMGVAWFQETDGRLWWTLNMAAAS